MSCGLSQEVEDALARIDFNAIGLMSLVNTMRRVRHGRANTSFKAQLVREDAGSVWLKVVMIARKMEATADHVDGGSEVKE